MPAIILIGTKITILIYFNIIHLVKSFLINLSVIFLVSFLLHRLAYELNER